MSKQTEESPKGLEKELLDEKKRRINAEAELETLRESNKRLSTQNSKLRKKENDSEPAVEKSSVTEHSATEHSHAQEEPKAPVEPSGGLPPAPGVARAASILPPVSGSEGVHLVKSWSPRFCPDCGTKNPDFKDEVQCHNCKVGLGAKEKVTSSEFKVCPNCGRGKDNGGGWEFVPGAKVV